MMCDRVRKRRKGLFRREPAEGTHREIVVFSVPDSKLLLEVAEGKELVIGIKVFIVFAMAALDLAVVPWSEGLNAFVLNAKLIQRHFKERFLICALRVEPIGKLRAIVRLDALNSIRKAFHTMLNELRGRIRIVLFESFQITKTAVFINESVLVIITAILFGISTAAPTRQDAGTYFTSI